MAFLNGEVARPPTRARYQHFHEALALILFLQILHNVIRHHLPHDVSAAADP